MLITKFNSMIRNRVIWTAFAVIVSVSFLGFMGPRNGCRKGKATDREIGAVGLLAGKSVFEPEFNRARYFEMGMREKNVPKTDEASKMLRTRTWKRLAALHAASDFGITVGDAELGQTIRRDPSFKTNGHFDRDLYKNVISKQLNVSLDTFEQYLRESLTLRKLVDVLHAAVWTSPTEIRERLANLTDSMQAAFAVVTPDATADHTDATEKEAKEYYDGHKEEFTVPAKVSVRYLTFPIADHFSTNEITDAQIREYYEDNIQAYQAPDTNGVNVEIPLEKVRGEIVVKIAREASVYKARDAATEFSLQMIPDRNGKAMTFDQAATVAKLNIATTGLFTAYDDVPGIDMYSEFKEAAFRLDTNDVERSVSDPVTGSNVVYVLTLASRIEPEVPAFDQVREKAMAAAAHAATRQAFEKRAKAARERIAAAVKAGKSFTAAASEAGLNVSTTATFTVYESMQSNTFEHAESIVPAVAALAVNEVSDLVTTTNGQLVACLLKRDPADMMTSDGFRPQLQGAMENYRAGIVFDEWADALLLQYGFKDYRVQSAESAPSSEDGEADHTAPGKPNKDHLQQLL